MNINPDQVSSFLLKVLEFFKIETDEVIIHFVSEEKISVLHGLFFNDLESTDCISFPIDGDKKKTAQSDHILGECFINPKEAINFAKDEPYEELSRYIIHCILHFIGHVDNTKEERNAMSSLENQALDFVKSKKVLLSNPVPLYK